MKTMQNVWDYIGQVINAKNNTYKSGCWGQFDENGKQQFDCVNVIKACAWEVPINKDIKANQYDYIANHREMPDVSIDYFYNRALEKGALNSLPRTKYSFLYQNGAHIGIYNPTTQTVREVCAGRTMGAIERSYKDYPVGYWNKWSDGSYFDDSKAPSAVQGYLDIVTITQKNKTTQSITVDGWAFDVSGTKTIKINIYDGAGTRVLQVKTKANKSRPDVKEVMGYSTDKVGFKTTFGAQLDKGKYRVKAVCNGKGLTHIHTVQIE